MAALKTKITKKTSAKGKGKKPARKKPADGKYVDRTDDEPSTDESMDGHIDSHELDTASNARSNGVDLLKKATEKTILKVKQRDPEKDKTTSFTAKDFQQAFVSTQCSICGAVGYHHWLSLLQKKHLPSGPTIPPWDRPLEGPAFPGYWDRNSQKTDGGTNTHGNVEEDGNGSQANKVATRRRTGIK